jgi:hypothetical protein
VSIGLGVGEIGKEVNGWRSKKLALEERLGLRTNRS